METLYSSSGGTGREPVVFFDGVCVLCNGFADFVVKRDRAGVFRLSPLQGETARKILGKIELNTIVLWQNERAFHKSDAVLEILKRLPGWGVAARIGGLVPRFLRDWVYDFIARRRYGWFGKRDSCRLPTAEERSRFLP